MKTSGWRVGVVEDDAAFRDHIVRLLEQNESIADVRSWKSAEEYLRDADPYSLDLLCVDCVLPHMRGSELIGRVKAVAEDMHLLMMTNSASDEEIFEAIQSGATACVWKPEIEDLTAQVQILMNGGATMSPTIALRVMREMRQVPGDPGLTEKERQVLAELVKGRSAPEIAGLLQVKNSTVKTHVLNIYRKFQVNSRAALIDEAWKRGMAGQGGPRGLGRGA